MKNKCYGAVLQSNVAMLKCPYYKYINQRGPGGFIGQMDRQERNLEIEFFCVHHKREEAFEVTKWQILNFN